jgi:hypothetical protein
MAVVPAALLAGCGGGDDSAPETPILTPTAEQPQPLSKEEFIKQGDAICGEANAALAALDTSAGSDPNLQAAQEVEITRGELESLQSLSAPNQDRSVLDRFLAALQDQVDALSRKQAAVEGREDPSSAEAEASSAASSAQAAAQEYGFKDCANASESTATTGVTTAPPVTTTTTPTVPTTPTTTVPTTPTTPPTGGTGGGGGTAGGTGGGSGGGGGGGTGGTGGGGISP